MVQDTRWPTIPLIAVRGVQLVFSIILLGLSAYLTSVSDVWWAPMSLVSALFSIIYIGINFFLLFTNLLLPLAITVTDAFLAILWLISMAGTGASGVLEINDCKFYTTDFFVVYTWTSIACQVSKASFAISFLLLLLFIGSLVLAAMVLFKNRKDLHGAKYNAGMDPDGNPLPGHAGAVGAAPAVPDAVAMGNVPIQPQYYQDPQKTEYYQQPPTPQPYQPTPQPYQPTTSPVYYNAPGTTQPMVSPPATPAPYSQGAGYPQEGVGAPPPPPPVNPAEMPIR